MIEDNHKLKELLNQMTIKYTTLHTQAVHLLQGRNPVLGNTTETLQSQEAYRIILIIQNTQKNLVIVD